MISFRSRSPGTLVEEVRGVEELVASERYGLARLTHDGRGGHFRGYLPTSFYQISEFYKIFRKTVDIFSNSEKFGKILTKIHLIRCEK